MPPSGSRARRGWRAREPEPTMSKQDRAVRPRRKGLKINENYPFSATRPKREAASRGTSRPAGGGGTERGSPFGAAPCQICEQETDSGSEGQRPLLGFHFPGGVDSWDLVPKTIPGHNRFDRICLVSYHSAASWNSPFAASQWVPRDDSCDFLVLSEQIYPSAKPFRDSDRRKAPDRCPDGHTFGQGFYKRPNNQPPFFAGRGGSETLL